MTATLTDLERKLVDLERELAEVAGGSSTAVAPQVPDGPAERRDAGLRVNDLRGEINDLVKFRDQLEAAAKELVSEYDRLVARLRTGGEETAGDAGPVSATSTPAGAAEESAPDADAAPEAGATPERELPPAVAAGLPGGGGHVRTSTTGTPGGEAFSFVGAVVVDAGPFSDITTLQSFEQALARVEGAEDVYVKSFEGNRALIDVRLSNPVPLVRLLREQLALPIIPREAGEGRLTVDLAAADAHGT